MVTPHQPQSSLIVVLRYEHKALKRLPKQLAMAVAKCQMELMRLFKSIDCTNHYTWTAEVPVKMAFLCGRSAGQATSRMAPRQHRPDAVTVTSTSCPTSRGRHLE